MLAVAILSFLLFLGIILIVSAITLTGNKEISDAEDRVEEAEAAYLRSLTERGL